MNYIQTYESFNKVGKWFKKHFLTDPYVVTYTVTNYKANLNNGRVEILDSKDSSPYEYVTFAESEKDAIDKFTQAWNKEVGAFNPRPKLNIKSVKCVGILNVQAPSDKFSVGGFKNKIHLF